MCWGWVRVLLMLIRLWVAGGVRLAFVSLAAAVTPAVCEPGGLALAALPSKSCHASLKAILYLDD